MLNRIASKDMLLAQAQQLKARKFKPGFDNMTPDAANLWIAVNGERLIKEIKCGDYQPMPAVGFRIAKKCGSYRQIAKLTALDTIIQNAVIAVVEEAVEIEFSDHSFAYRRGRGVSDALMQYCTYGSQYGYAAKLDPVSCFSNLDHSVIRNALSSFLTQHEVVDLIMKFVAMPVVIDNEIIYAEKGILQGAPISGLICNIYFDSIDKYLESLRIPFIRYADDIVIFGATPSEIKHNCSLAEDYLQKVLMLTKNDKKSMVDSPSNIVYLGHRFVVDRHGMIALEADSPINSAYYKWHQSHPENNHGRVDILSDGILRQQDYSLLFESDSSSADIPIATTNVINIYSNVIFDNGFLQKALSKGIIINLFGQNNKLTGSFYPNTYLRSPRVTHEQILAYYDAPHRLDLARKFVLASIHNLRLNIRYYNKQNASAVYEDALKHISIIVKSIKECEDYNELLILEAQVRKLYFGCFDSFISVDGFAFERRTRKPPENEVNAMISFGNTVLYNLLSTELYKSALDVRVGYLHATNNRQESLNLDIAEIFKPLVVDRVVFSLINRKMIQKKHFTVCENNGVYLSREGKHIFLQAFYEKLETVVSVKERKINYSQIIYEEIQKLTRHFKTGEKYIPFKQVR